MSDFSSADHMGQGNERDKQLKLFETWAKENWMHTWDKPNCFNKCSIGTYIDSQVEWCFIAWQTALFINSKESK